MTNKNPKKNYSLKGKPLSTKIAFVVICVLVFSLILGSFGGLIYLGKSCSSTFTTVSAEGNEGAGSSTTTTVVDYATLNLSSVHYQVYGAIAEDESPVGDLVEFMFFLPVTVRSVTVDGRSLIYLDVETWNSYDYNSTASYSILLSSLAAGESHNFNLGVMDIYMTLPFNMGFRITASTVLVEEFGALASVELSFFGNDLSRRTINLKLYDINGVFREYVIAPLFAQGSRGYFLNPNTGYSATFVYSINPFTLDSISNAYKQGYDAGMKSGEFLYNEGYDDGYFEGYNRGTIVGASEAGNYTFVSLLDAVFYAPVKMFVSLFNFDFLGVNVLGFVTTLITVIIAFGIVKFFI